MIYIVIPVFNRKQFTKDCLDSLRKQTDKRFKIVVVDDGSTDGTSEMLKEEYPEVHVLYGDGNLFWTAATNMGIRYALENNADYVLTLNNDVIAVEDYIEKMYYWAEKEPNSLLGSMALDTKTNKPTYGGEIIHWMSHSYTFLLDVLPENEQTTGIHEVSHFPGRGLLIPKAVFDKIGLYAEKALPHYMADHDFTHKAKRHGFKIFCNYDAKIFTYPEASGDQQNRKKKSLKKYYEHLFGIRGGGNLKNFTIYTFRNCPIYYMPSFLVIGYSKRILGYILH
ncbi:glycosyltransferase family 2 protein [Chondrinema litorale]|uniref:glycosyltransferase family 2 protein n=1 Tax=Chondrinema litorale TaxID=2994555 RepID=UPI0025436EFC|nr:glycosyltransferase family 2 protein [Chondrinema litorale]UZR93205.1 glycosyltransferase family 2 protein [Chondrinema litorale]